MELQDMMYKHGKHFENYILVDIPKPLKILQISIDKDLNKLVKNTNRKSIDISTLTGPLLCPLDKEYNKRTKRCIKKCKPNQTRNANNRCINIKRSKSVKSVNSKVICKNGQIYNPDTNRCNKILNCTKCNKQRELLKNRVYGK
jgi:hypothetical protein